MAKKPAAKSKKSPKKALKKKANPSRPKLKAKAPSEDWTAGLYVIEFSGTSEVLNGAKELSTVVSGEEYLFFENEEFARNEINSLRLQFPLADGESRASDVFHTIGIGVAKASKYFGTDWNFNANGVLVATIEPKAQCATKAQAVKRKRSSLCGHVKNQYSALRELDGAYRSDRKHLNADAQAAAKELAAFDKKFGTGKKR